MRRKAVMLFVSAMSLVIGAAACSLFADFDGLEGTAARWTLQLAAFFKLDEGTGLQTSDCSAKHLVGVLEPDAGWGTGVRGGALTMNASYVTLGDVEPSAIDRRDDGVGLHSNRWTRSDGATDA